MSGKRARKSRYSEGDWFAVPLRNGGLAPGLITRMAPRGRILLGYFFGPRRQSLPDVNELRDFRPEHAVLVARFGDLSLLDGTWPVLGRADNCSREHWPIPDFVRTDVMSGVAQRIRYDPEDPSTEVIAGSTTDAPIGSLPQDGLSGAGAVEIKLSRLLSAND